MYGPVILAQTSQARLGEISRDVNPVAVWASRSGDEDWIWATRTLAQARWFRLSEMVLKLRVLSATSRLGEG